MTGRAMGIFCGVLLLAGACDEAEERSGVGEGNGGLELRDLNMNTFNLNTFNLNTFNLNAFNLNTFNLNGDNGNTDSIRATEFKYDASDVPDIWLVGSQIQLETTGGVVLTGPQINKLKIKYDVLENGKLKKKVVKITNATQLAPGSDIWVYDLDYKVEAGVWAPLCVDANGNRTQAILLGDVWNAATGARRVASDAGVTYACRGAALAKCVEWGYKPWTTSADNVSLYDYHQACTRMVRADYCGEGVAHTVTGTPIHVLDQHGVQKKDPNVNYVVEAEWGPNGATCLNSANTRLPDQSLSCQLPACGASFSSGGLIQSGKVL